MRLVFAISLAVALGGCLDWEWNHDHHVEMIDDAESLCFDGLGTGIPTLNWLVSKSREEEESWCEVTSLGDELIISSRLYFLDVEGDLAFDVASVECSFPPLADGDYIVRQGDVRKRLTLPTVGCIGLR